MAVPEPSWGERWVARGLMLAGLWLTGTGIIDVVRLTPFSWGAVLPHLMGLLAGICFLAGAWKMRDVIRWDPADND